eukprot:14607552-Alexandrium_andersonii.AAC.1
MESASAGRNGAAGPTARSKREGAATMGGGVRLLACRVVVGLSSCRRRARASPMSAAGRGRRLRCRT